MDTQIVFSELIWPALSAAMKDEKQRVSIVPAHIGVYGGLGNLMWRRYFTALTENTTGGPVVYAMNEPQQFVRDTYRDFRKMIEENPNPVFPSPEMTKRVQTDKQKKEKKVKDCQFSNEHIRAYKKMVDDISTRMFSKV